MKAATSAATVHRFGHPLHERIHGGPRESPSQVKHPQKLIYVHFHALFREMLETDMKRRQKSKSLLCGCVATTLRQSYNSFHIKYIPSGIALPLSHILQVFDNSHAPAHHSPRLGLLDAASSDSVIARQPVERGRVRMRQKRAQPQQGVSKTSHGSPQDSSSASNAAILPGRLHQ